jgi:DedD protein
METRLKERLTGAAILVALIVLVVPELFHGQHEDVAANTSSSGEGPPVRSYTIDLSNGSARKAPLQSTDSAGESTAGTTPASGSAAPNAPSAPSSPAASTASPATTAMPAAPAVSAPKTKPAAVPAPAPALSPAPAPTPPSHAASKSASAGSWSVQLGLFASRDNAERLLKSAQGKGFSVSVSEADGKGLYHVVANGLADRGAAQTLQGRLQTQGFQAAVVAPQSGNLKSSR